MYHNLFIPSSVDGHLGCFHVLPIVNSVAINKGIHVSFSVLVSSGYMPRSWIAGSLVQFSSVTQSCLTLCDPMNRSTPGLPVHYQLPEFIQTHFHWVSDAIQSFHPLSFPSASAFNLPQHQSFPVSQFFISGGQSIGASASTSVLPMNIQD